MPETTSVPHRVRMFKLSNADRENQVVRISCGWCRQTRRYLPKDMIQLIGDVPVYHLADDMRCDNCKRRGYLRARCETIAGSDIGRIKVRRLVEVKILRVPVWRETSL
jgi:hypothetical protein